MSTSTLRRLGKGLLVAALTLVPLVASATPAQAASEASVGIVNKCGSLYVRPTLVAVFQQHTSCGTVRDTAISPDGRYIAVINTDGSLSIKDGLWGQWQTHVGPNDAKKVALGPNGMVGIVNGCGATMIKTSIFGAWQQHTSCESTVDLAISPEGRYVAVINTDRSLAIKDGLWGAWQTHLGAGDANDVTFGPNGMVGVVNACHAMYIKTSITGAWDQHLGCNGARSVAISPDGQVIGAITADGSSFAKQGLWGAWVNQTQAGDTQAIFVGPGTVSTAGQPSSPPPSAVGDTIVAIAQREAGNGSRNHELPAGSNCNFYTTALRTGSPTKCTAGYTGQAWCADFGRWVWAQAGAKTTYLTAGAISFKDQGVRLGTWKSGGGWDNARVGDAIVFNLNTATTADDHVGTVTAKNSSDHTITIISGNASDSVRADTFAPGTTTKYGYVSGYTSPQRA